MFRASSGGSTREAGKAPGRILLPLNLASSLQTILDMITTTLAQGNDSPLDTWLSVEPDLYLDARRPEWRRYEVAGLVRFVRRSGERRGRLRVAPSATGIIEVLTSPLSGPELQKVQ